MTERMSDELKQAMKATPPEELYEYLMDCHIPKSEAEHYAADKIAELEEKLAESNRLFWQKYVPEKELKAEVDRLREGYREAIDDIESWGAYASQFFQKKHDLKGCVADHLKALENTND